MESHLGYPGRGFCPSPTIEQGDDRTPHRDGRIRAWKAELAGIAEHAEAMHKRPIGLSQGSDVGRRYSGRDRGEQRRCRARAGVKPGRLPIRTRTKHQAYQFGVSPGEGTVRIRHAEQRPGRSGGVLHGAVQPLPELPYTLIDELGEEGVAVTDVKVERRGLHAEAPGEFAHGESGQAPFFEERPRRCQDGVGAKPGRVRHA